MQEPITREEMYLASAAGYDVDLPEPVTRKEFFLAKLAGMDVETPAAFTRREMFIENAANNRTPGVVINNQDITINENGKYTADEGYTGLGVVTVEVPDIPAVTQPLEITENGTYTAPNGVDGYNPVVVNVPDPTKNVLLAEQEFSGFALDETFGAYSPGYVTPALFTLNNGETYHVKWDGTEYECKAFTFNYSGMSLVVIGNGTSLGLSGNGEPFLITYNAAYNNTQIFSVDTKSSHTVGIWQKVLAGSDDVRYVTFMNHDGTVEYGKKAVAVGDDCADPIARGIFDTPTRESDAQYNYTFYSWATTPNGGAVSSWNKEITEDKTVYANFTSSVRYYTITYYDSNGSTVLKTESLAYGAIPSYTASKEGYGFGGWTPTPVAVTKNASYVAKWVEKVTFANGSWADIVRIANSGEAQNYFAIGDQKKLTYTDPEGNQKTSTVQIVGFNHDDLADGSGKASMSILTVTGDFAWRYNADYSKTYSAGWAGCELRDDLNATVFNSFPEALRDGIKTVKKTSRIYVDGTDTTGLCESNDDIWIPSFTEMGGTGTSTNSLYGYAEGDGVKYGNIDMAKITLNTNSYVVSNGTQVPEAVSVSYISTRSGGYMNKYQTINYSCGKKRYESRPHGIYPVVIFGFCI